MRQMRQWPDAGVLRQQVEAYFAACDATAEQIALKSGGMQHRQIPYTMAGLAAHVGLDQEELRIMLSFRGRDREQQAACQVVRDAYRRVEGYLVAHALLGDLNPAAVEAHLLQWRQKEEKKNAHAEEGEQNNKLRVIMEDKEGWSQ